MNENNAMIKPKETLMIKIKRFFKNIFGIGEERNAFPGVISGENTNVENIENEESINIENTNNGINYNTGNINNEVNYNAGNTEFQENVNADSTKTEEAFNNTRNQFLEEIKVAPDYIDKDAQRKKFLKEINGNEEALKALSIDQLRKLEKYYDGVIAENEKKIKQLKNS